MADESFEEKTEQATPRKIQKAREKGEVPRSREITGIIPMWSVLLYLVFGGAVLTSLMNYVRTALQRSCEFRLTDGSVVELFKADSMQAGMLLLPLFTVILVVTIAVHFLQTGFMFSGTPLAPDISKINPLQGMKRYFSLNMVVETLKGILKVIVLGMVLFFVLKAQFTTLPLMVDMNIHNVQMFSFHQIFRLMLIATIVITIFAAADFAYQRWYFSRNLRMTKQEIKEEHKEVEGSPLVKARMKSLQREMARRRMMQEVPKA
ncbi:MAG TPA: EscU/YscU/HrcU family type III secretion system export apparatus switch protein, partial [Dissulfurispiraceae bacterium]|nr:EscU/YscU/HrcU family type III secretion system export apparatus switch protein [Dissulfurispiraceae bacterium]